MKNAVMKKINFDCTEIDTMIMRGGVEWDAKKLAVCATSQLTEVARVNVRLTDTVKSRHEENIMFRNPVAVPDFGAASVRNPVPPLLRPMAK